MEVIRSAENIQIGDMALFELEDVQEKYKEYIRKLGLLEERYLEIYLKYIKQKEIINNQEVESEDKFLLELYQRTQRYSSIDMVMKCLSDGKLTIDEIKRIHKQVIKGSSDDLEKNYDFRSDNEKWVGYYLHNGERKIDYYPPDYIHIKDILTNILNDLNSHGLDVKVDNIFVNPFIMHALIAYLQPFGNGNTRLARVLQHGKMCELTNDVFNTSFKTPTFYLSENYKMTRGNYRDLIKRIACEKNNEVWNAWLIYNLHQAQDQLYYLDTQVSKM